MVSTEVARISALPAPANNVHDWNGESRPFTFGPRGVQYVVYTGPGRRPLITKIVRPEIGERSLGSACAPLGDTALVASAERPGQTDPDDHMYYAVGVSPDGTIHVMGNMHGHALRYVRSAVPSHRDMAAPTDIETWLHFEIMVAAGDEDRVTYPQFFTGVHGDLFVLYRNRGPSGAYLSAAYYINRYDHLSQQWVRVCGPLHDTANDTEIAYPKNVAVDPVTGAWHLFWFYLSGRRPRTDYNGFGYMVSPDEGVTWTRSDGVPYRLPITRDQVEYVVETERDVGLFTHHTAVDRAGAPHLLTMMFRAGARSPALHLGRRVDGCWRLDEVPGTGAPVGGQVLHFDGENRPFAIWRSLIGRRRASIIVTEIQPGSSRARHGALLAGYDLYRRGVTVDPELARDGTLSFFLTPSPRFGSDNWFDEELWESNDAWILEVDDSWLVSAVDGSPPAVSVTTIAHREVEGVDVADNESGDHVVVTLPLVMRAGRERLLARLRAEATGGKPDAPLELEVRVRTGDVVVRGLSRLRFSAVTSVSRYTPWVPVRAAGGDGAASTRCIEVVARVPAGNARVERLSLEIGRLAAR